VKQIRASHEEERNLFPKEDGKEEKKIKFKEKKLKKIAKEINQEKKGENQVESLCEDVRIFVIFTLDL
jgi:hypothetical protein